MISLVPFDKNGLSNRLVSDYLSGKDFSALKMGRSKVDWNRQIESFSKITYPRKLLQKIIKQQYEGLVLSPQAAENLSRIVDENTFMVCCAHQTNILGGPAYFFHKIIATIKLAKKIEKKTGKKMIPVYWMGSEDHDFEELNHLYLFNEKFEWQTNQSGAVGRMILDYSFMKLLQAVFDKMGNSDEANELKSLIAGCFVQHSTLANATRKMVNELLGKYGLLVLDQDNAELKKYFADVMKDELQNSNSVLQVHEAQQQLSATYAISLYPREINMFYLADNERILIERENHQYKIAARHFTNEEMLKMLQESPQNFSPNVILRPLYQQMVLPAIAFVGGGGELSYWMQLGLLFADKNVPYPYLYLRENYLYVENKSLEQWHEMNLADVDIFEDTDKVKRKFADGLGDQNISLQTENDKLQEILNDINEKVKQLDASLETAFKIEEKKIQQAVKQLEEKMLREVKRKHEVEMKRIEKMKSKTFPNNTFQERRDSFFQFCLMNKENLIDILMKIDDVEQGDCVIVSI